MFDKSVAISDNVIILAVKLATEYPNEYGKNYLMSLVLDISARFHIAEKEMNEEYDIMKIVLNRIMNEVDKALILGKISKLIKEMLAEVKLKKIVNGFIEYLIIAELYDVFIYIIKNLRYVKGFDSYYWIKQAVNRGDVDVRDKMYSLLCSYANISKYNIYDFLGEIYKWLPDTKIEPYSYSQSNKMALYFSMDYSINSIVDLEITSFGIWPSEYPLFNVLYNQESFENMSLFISWLFHPGMKNIYNEEDISGLYASIILEWGLVLLGTNKQNVYSESLNLFTKIIDNIIKRINDTQYKSIIKEFNNIDNYLLEKLNDLAGLPNDIIRKNYIIRRNACVRIRREMINLKKFSK